MGAVMVDVSSKETVYREAVAEGFIRLKPELAKLVSSTGFVGLGNVAASASTAAVMAVKRAWEYIPFLHPIPITHSSAHVDYGEDGLRLTVVARTIAQTGVEMDALFGLLVGLVTAWNVIKARHCTCGPNEDCDVVEESPGLGISLSGIGEIRGIEGVRVVRKVKGSWGIDAQLPQVQAEAPHLVSLFDATEEPVYVGEAVAEGFIRLRDSTVERIRAGSVEKGDVFVAAQVAAITMAKRAWELLPLIHQNYITHISVGFDIKDGGVLARVTTKNISRTGSAMEALMATGTALLTIWDMVKKYEKDEEGQYPYTEISFIRLVKSTKRVLQ